MDKILENDFEDDLTNVVESIMFALGREISAKEINVPSWLIIPCLPLGKSSYE